MFEGVDQLRDLARTMDLSQRSTRIKARDIVRKYGFEVERGAKLRAPVDTGNLRSSISTAVTGDGLGEPVTAEVGPEANYGVFVELGTWKMAPQPYLGPAFDEVEPSFLKALEQLAEEIGQ